MAERPGLACPFGLVPATLPVLRQLAVLGEPLSTGDAADLLERPADDPSWCSLWHGPTGYSMLARSSRAGGSSTTWSAPRTGRVGRVSTMDAEWWELPGPAAFLRTAWEDVRGGKNVVLALPATAPAGLRGGLSALVRQAEMWAWRDYPAGDGAGSSAALVEQLHQRFAPPKGGGVVLLSADTLAADPRLADTVIWVEGMTATSWPASRLFWVSTSGPPDVSRAGPRVILRAAHWTNGWTTAGSRPSRSAYGGGAALWER